MKHLNPLLIKRLSLVVFFSLGIFLFFILDGFKYFNLNELKLAYNRANLYVNEHIIVSSFTYALIYIATVFFSVPIKPFLKILAGLLFGLYLGFIISLFSATIGATLTFLIIKYTWGESSSNSKIKVVSKFKSLVVKHPILVLFVARLVPMPFFIPNVLAAILNVKNSIFFFTTLLGIIPFTFIYVWFGVHFKDSLAADTVNSFVDYKFVLALSVLGLMSLIPFIFKAYYKKKKNRA
ncbi:VTT domain-containing protein [Francisella sp. 19X1-34]|uniref:TVP38/TMEM64 family protein n=1 Tax=Francisella sp. 19X1-34 TaxID=3087177 RepID=UPI002E338C3C|nr:VTT domain-containing protein [Francisella sp. 19X1-34]MED7788977.1 VTT domain-containing protein [Francisella sp. 19X1-34]